MKAGEMYRRAMEITDQAEADRWFEFCVQEHLKERPDHSRKQAEEIQSQNIGYFAGYYDTQTRLRVEKLFRAVHPVFGSVAKHGDPSPDVAFKMGQIYGSMGKGKNN